MLVDECSYILTGSAFKLAIIAPYGYCIRVGGGGSHEDYEVISNSHSLHCWTK